jgi:hypothetical protein
LRALFLWDGGCTAAILETLIASFVLGSCGLDLELDIHAVHSDAAEKLGVEVGGFLRHDFASGGDAHDLIDVNGIEEKSDLGGATVDGIERGGGFAFVSEIALGGDGLRSDAESGFEDSVVEEDDVQLTLKRRNGVEELREIGAAAKR